MTETENVRVMVRIRPVSKKESNITRITEVDSSSTIINIAKQTTQTSELPKTYTFDHIFEDDATQTDVYCQSTRPIVEKLFEGYNGTVLAYGQTGTGKTYTMTGLKLKDQEGVIPNTFSHIFSHIAKAKEELTFLIHVTYMEIYNECVRDLLAKTPSNNLEVREHTNLGVFVQDLSGYLVRTCEELENLMKIGEKNRSVGATDLNLASSRSHTIFTITLESIDKNLDDGQELKRGKLHLVDLAGSERQSKTHATGIRFREASKINQSLSVLGNVISALVDGKSHHIPYRNSKLTRLLQDSLGGNSKTLMIATISPLVTDYEETVSTLRYANRAKNIQNRTFVNEQPKEAMLKQFQNEILALRAQLEKVNSDDQHLYMLGPQPPTSVQYEKATRAITEQKRLAIEHCIEDEELTKTKYEQAKIQNKLMQLTNKIIVGGVNLLEKAQNQEFLLEVAASELEQSLKIQEELKQTLQMKEAERIDFKERYSTLQEEAVGKTKKLKKLSAMIMAAKTELADLHKEHQREMEGILDTVRGLTREVQLAELIINSYIPREYQSMIERYISWNEEIGEYQLKCVAYTGNNMRKRLSDSQGVLDKETTPKVTVYRQYSTPIRKPKSRCSNVPRPTRQY